jgi:hypothetical protein
VNKEESYQTDQNHTNDTKDYNMDLDFNSVTAPNAGSNPYGLSQPAVPLTQQYLSSKVPEIG